MEAFCQAQGVALPGNIPDVVPGEVLVLDPGQGPARKMQAIPGSGDRRRHRRKYAEGRLGTDTSFYFRGGEGKLNLRAHNLTMFVDLADGVDEATWDWHRHRGDYSRWLRDCVKDMDLAGEVAAVEQDQQGSSEARRKVRMAVERRYTAPG